MGAKTLFLARQNSFDCISKNQSLALKKAVAFIMRLPLFLINHNLIIAIAIDLMNNKRTPARAKQYNDNAAIARRSILPNDDTDRCSSRLRINATAARPSSASKKPHRHNGIPPAAAPQARQSTQNQKRTRGGVNGKEVCNLEQS